MSWIRQLPGTQQAVDYLTELRDEFEERVAARELNHDHHEVWPYEKWTTRRRAEPPATTMSTQTPRGSLSREKAAPELHALIDKSGDEILADVLTALLKITVLIFMAGNLLDLGLRLDLRAALHGMRDVRFVTLSVVWSFILCPVVAWGLTRVIPLTESYAMGLILLGLTPCAPLLPTVAERARGDLNYAATFMVLASFGTVVQMPFAVPFMIEGLTVSAWAIVRPLLILVVIPLAIGVGIQTAWPKTAARIQPLIKKGTGIDTVVMLILVLIIYGNGFVGSVGSYAISAQAVFYLVITAGSYALSFGMPLRQKAVMSLGLCTRNCGTALAPLFIATDVDQSAIVMVTLGIPMMFISSLIAARVFAARSPQPGEPVRSERQAVSATGDVG